MKNEIRPIYFELQGYLSQAPEREVGVIYEEQVWQQHNLAIDELEKITSKDYSRYRLTTEAPNVNGVTRKRITVQGYRTILGGLISRLHGEYFHEDPSPIK